MTFAEALTAEREARLQAFRKRMAEEAPWPWCLFANVTLHDLK